MTMSIAYIVESKTHEIVIRAWKMRAYTWILGIIRKFTCLFHFYKRIFCAPLCRTSRKHPKASMKPRIKGPAAIVMVFRGRAEAVWLFYRCAFSSSRTTCATCSSLHRRRMDWSLRCPYCACSCRRPSPHHLPPTSSQIGTWTRLSCAR